ncbi:hypothetical protein MKX01_042791 [Papaver californicum]|nr:hypothetical protein MKX01_042791 [Papaver californicum]
MSPASQVVNLKFPSKTRKSGIRLELERNLANLLVTDEKDRQALIRKLKKCDNIETHSKIRFSFSLDAKDETSWAPLHWKAYYGKEVVMSLLIGGENPTLITPPTPNYLSGHATANIASTLGHVESVAYLTETVNNHGKIVTLSVHHAKRSTYLAETLKIPEKIVPISSHPAKRGIRLCAYQLSMQRYVRTDK